MNDRQRKHFERGARVSAFGAANPADFPTNSVAGESLARLNEQLERIETLNVAKATSMSAQQQGSQGRRDVRAQLRSHIKNIYDTAKIIGRDHPEVKGLFQRAQTDKSDQTLLAVARSYSAAAQPLKARFIEYGMAADFFDSFNADIEDFEQHIARQSEGTGTRVATNAGLEDALRLVDEEVERLKIINHNKYGNDPAKLAAWESASHLERPARKKREGDGKDGGSTNKGEENKN
jgi:hypothetical protein